MRNAEMVQHSGHDSVGDFFDRFWMRVEGGVGRENDRAREKQKFQVANLNQIQRGFARNEDQFFLFLEHHVGRSQENIFAVAMGDAAEGPHAAGNHDHSVGRIRAAGEGRVHALDAVASHTFRNFQALREFLGDHRLGVIADEQMQFMSARIQIIQQALGVDNSAGAGDGDDNLQEPKKVPNGKAFARKHPV